MDGGSCVDAHSKGFREALQLLFLANTEAVVLPEYSSALSAGIDGLQDVASCGARCALGAVVPGGGNVRVELAKRLLDNDLTPPVVLSLVLRHLGSAIVKEAALELWTLQRVSHRTEQLDKTFRQLFPAFDAPVNVVKQVAEEMMLHPAGLRDE